MPIPVLSAPDAYSVRISHLFHPFLTPAAMPLPNGHATEGNGPMNVPGGPGMEINTFIPAPVLGTYYYTNDGTEFWYYTPEGSRIYAESEPDYNRDSSSSIRDETSQATQPHAPAQHQTPEAVPNHIGRSVNDGPRAPSYAEVVARRLFGATESERQEPAVQQQWGPIPNMRFAQQQTAPTNGAGGNSLVPYAGGDASHGQNMPIPTGPSGRFSGQGRNGRNSKCS
jgi:hypothetical protein